MGFLSFLTQGSRNPDAQTSSTTTYNLPDWAKQYYQQVASTAQQVASQPYQQYGGQRVAPLSGNQSSAISNAQNNSYSFRPDMQGAEQSAQQGAQPFNKQGLDQFMNPYTENVVNRAGELGWQNFNRYVQPGIRDEFVGTGGFGGQRNMQTEQFAMDDTSRNVLGEQGQLLNQGYQNAQQQYGQWQDRSLNAAGVQAGLAGQRSSLEGQGEQQQLGTGALQQAQGQAELEVPYQYYQEQRDWPLRGLSAMTGAAPAVGQMPVNSSTVGTQPGGYQPSPLSMGLGAASIGSALGATPGLTAGLGMLGLFSDRRLKQNAELVGEHPTLGIGIYEYDIGGKRMRGYMADEVYEVMPEAVKVDPSGFLTVDYQMVNVQQ